LTLKPEPNPEDMTAADIEKILSIKDPPDFVETQWKKEEIGDDAAQDILDDEADSAFGGMPKGRSVSPRIQALRDFGIQLQEGDLAKRIKKKKKKDAESPTEAVALGAESVPGAGGIDQGSEISEEEE
jgi:hypothetical protein